ncbi:N4-gp56 family major capsid protein [Variovorax boronicumulans]|uniref:N4-gp56 family major capsid protein n=1 Tax=Variovorax boronicumulans TaxID=436515 RepID=A0AAW8CY34_9BURK|nr:N4-gp56 family major capsid protein [Variovorax boronicumulans]MDP9895374.1 N4-gp56 family major capsid protein [Variovorax boronicumulans]MDQ0055414.1 N4-gp56 family major capsid protein [Variovorax boronicumulans]
MSQTSIPYGSPLALKAQSVALFAATMQRPTNLGRLAGPMPTQSDAESNLRVQSSADYPIVRSMDLSKVAGDEVTFDLVNPIGGKPIMGGRMAEGRGEKMDFDQDKLRINQTRKPISAGDEMTQQRTPHQMRTLARAQGLGYMMALEDQRTLVHLAGARGFHNNVEWKVPLAVDADFPEIMINPVKAPTRNRHYMSTGTGLERVSASAGEIAIASTDVMNMDVVDSLRTVVDTIPLPPAPVKFDGDQGAEDVPLRVLLLSPSQYMSFKKSGNFRQLQVAAMARASQAKNNPLFTGDAGLWEGILLIKMPKPIRFYAGDSLRYCASLTSEVETSSDVVPASFAGAYAVDRAILLGGQALGEAWGKKSRSGNPFFWSEKELDHGDKLEILIGTVGGKSKIRFDVNQGDSLQPTDNGVIAIDTAVPLTAADAN